MIIKFVCLYVNWPNQTKLDQTKPNITRPNQTKYIRNQVQTHKPLGLSTYKLTN